MPENTEELNLNPAASTTTTSAPAETPAAVEPAANVEETSTEDWADIDSAEESEAPVAQPAAVTPAPAATPTPTPTPAVAATPAVTPPVVATPATETSAPAQPAATPVPQTAEQIEATRVAAVAEEAKHYDALKEYYQLPDDMAARLATEPELVLPELAAKVHQAVAKGLVNMMQAQLPGLIRGVQSFETVEANAKNSFYEKWPSLKGYEKQVLQVGAMYRQMNPTATPAEAIERIGQVVHASLGLQVPVGAAVPVGQAPAQTPVQQQVFTPAGGAGGGRAPAAPSENEFSLIADSLLRDDQ